MKGMTLQEYAQVVEFIETHHKFGAARKVENMITVKGEDFNLWVKYIDSCYDTRSHDVWMIKLRNSATGGYMFSASHFNPLNPQPDYFKFSSLFEWVMAFLKGEWTNNRILSTCMIN